MIKQTLHTLLLSPQFLCMLIAIPNFYYKIGWSLCCPKTNQKGWVNKSKSRQNEPMTIWQVFHLWRPESRWWASKTIKTAQCCFWKYQSNIGAVQIAPEAQKNKGAGTLCSSWKRNSVKFVCQNCTNESNLHSKNHITETPKDNPTNKILYYDPKIYTWDTDTAKYPWKCKQILPAYRCPVTQKLNKHGSNNR